jgi:glycosyltransferase involved in cell wall biosynthesis
VRRTPIAHVVFPRADPLRPVPGFAWDAVHALLEADDLDVEVLMPLPSRALRLPQSIWRGLLGRRSFAEDLEGALASLEPRPTFVRFVPLPNRSVESAAVAIAAHLLARPRAARPRLLHGSFLDEGGFAASVAARVMGCASIAVAHGTDVRVARRRLADRPSRRRRALETIAHATKLIAVSNDLAQEIALLGRSAEVVRYGTFASRFPLVPLNKAIVPRQVLFIGNVSRRKGVDVLMEAFALLAHQDAQLRIVGPHAGDIDVDADARRLGIGARVRVEGPVREEDVPSIVRESSCLVLPSRDEGFGIVLVEALLSGRPVVASRTGGIKEIVDDRVGRLVEPEDQRALARAIDEILDRVDRGWWTERELREHAMPMTWEEQGPRLAEITRELAR